MTIENIRLKYNIQINFLEYLSLNGCFLSNAIPKDWKFHLNIDPSQPINNKVKDIIFTTRSLYAEIIKRFNELPEEYGLYWSNELRVPIDELDWCQGYIECFKWTISSKLRSFYYALVKYALVNDEIMENPY